MYSAIAADSVSWWCWGEREGHKVVMDLGRESSHTMPLRSRSGTCINLINLPENVIVNILRCLPIDSKCKAQLVCKTFRDILCQPSPGVWGVVDLHDRLFDKTRIPTVTPCAFYSTFSMKALFSTDL